MSKDLTHRMSEAHERDLVKLLGGRQTRGSGNQWSNPMDGRHDRYEQAFAFCWDGKCTGARSIGVSLAMWRKAVEQSHGERPCLPLRFIADERLRVAEDLIVLDINDFVELLEAANKGKRMLKLVNEVYSGDREYHDTYADSAQYLFARELRGA